MTKPSSRVLAFRLDATLADLFIAWSKASGFQTPAKAFRAVVEHVVKQSPPTAAEPPAVTRQTGPRRHVGTRVPVVLHEQVVGIASQYGGTSAWLRAVIESATSDAPVAMVTKDETIALNQATVQLWHAATNLNQIAKHLNAARRAGEPLPFTDVTPESIDELRFRIEALADSNAALISDARRRASHRG
jgi:hypothetical protein